MRFVNFETFTAEAQILYVRNTSEYPFRRRANAEKFNIREYLFKSIHFPWSATVRP